MYKRQAEGYVYASVQAQHAIADNLAHVLYYSLGWNVDQRIPLGRVSLGTVCAQLARETTTAPELAPIPVSYTHLDVYKRQEQQRMRQQFVLQAQVE